MSFVPKPKWAAGAIALAVLCFSGSVFAAPTPMPLQITSFGAPTLQIPNRFTVTADINNALKGTVVLSGVATTLDVIVPQGGYNGQTSGVVYDTNGVDVTSDLGPSIVSTLVAAYEQAAANQGISSAPAVQAQNYGNHFEPARMATERTTGDLQRIMDQGNLTEDQSRRLDAAVRDLHLFRESVDNGNFDRDRLDHAMQDIEFVMNNAQLNGGQQNELREDLDRLRDLSDRFGQ